MNSKLSVIIVNYNVQYFLEQALLAVRRAAGNLPVEVWVVDNNSVDDSVKMVRQKFPEVHLIANSDNPGFAVANNQAIRRATGEYILLLNPDTVIEEDTFDKCIAFMDNHPKAGGLGVRMIDGTGAFLPESKRGFPSPWVAFCKTFGLSRFFPRSRWFNGYHLGYLPEDEVHEVDVLAGAFMLLRRSVLDEIGMLDEQFFMYGEDIDLSYRITQAGYRNYYFPETTIIHYKGESTKKGSLNYVRTFYQAMIIFARKHFRGSQARLFVGMLQIAIYLRAALTLLSNWLRRAALPLFDAALIFGGLLFLKRFWAVYHFRDPDYYDNSFLYFNAPLYTMIWVVTIFFSGGYDAPGNLRRLLRGVFAGTVLLAAVYGFLEMEYRSSRALILMGAVWAALATTGLRYLRHFLLHRNFRMGREHSNHLVIVGTQAESDRVRHLLTQAGVQKNFIGTVLPAGRTDEGLYLSTLPQLEEVTRIYKVDELIFCSRDVPAQAIMNWMTRLGPEIEYRIVPEEGLSIIGSSSKNTAGELYTIEVRFNIAQALHRRNKRILDLVVALLLLLTFPLQLFFLRRPSGLAVNLAGVFLGRKSWVGYCPVEGDRTALPPLRTGILSPLDEFKGIAADRPTRRRLNLFYAKDYTVWRDVDILWKGWRGLGRKEDAGNRVPPSSISAKSTGNREGAATKSETGG